MTATGWFLEDIDREDHATPHAFVDEDAGAREPLIASGPVGGFAPYCLYSFPTYPDGLLRTSASDYAKFLMACVRVGAGGTGGVLAAETLRSMLKDHEDTRTADRLEAVQGLCWVGSRDGRGRERWSHSGADPGVRTLAMMDVDSGAAALAFANGPAGEYLYEAVERLLDHARTVA